MNKTVYRPYNKNMQRKISAQTDKVQFSIIY